jgi:hypothetical protein
MLGGRNRVSTKELSDLIQFNNCSYIFRGKLNVYGKLPIVINNMLNISIKGLNK